MKKVIFGAMLCFAIASCDQAKTCECTTEYLDGSVSTVDTFDIEEGDCSDSNASGAGFTTTCREID